MYRKKETAELIIDNGRDYVLQEKANQGNFYKDIYAKPNDKYMNEAAIDCEYAISTIIEKSHGRKKHAMF